jgi:preprotein translocase SecE subunit
MTAVLIAALFVSAAAWAYTSLEAVSLPVKAWEFNLREVSGPITPGQEVEILSTRLSPDSTPLPIGTAKVLNVAPGSAGEAKVQLGEVRMTGTATPEDAVNQRVRIGPAGSGVTAAVQYVSAIPIFERLYLQAGIAGLLLLTGAGLAYYLAGVKASTVDFLIATDNEMKKVNWSTRREILGSTYVVVSACLLIALFLFLIDYAFSHFFMAIDVLRSK